MASCREMNPDGSYALAVSFAPGGRPGWDVRLDEAVSDPAFVGTFRIAAQASSSTNYRGVAWGSVGRDRHGTDHEWRDHRDCGLQGSWHGRLLRTDPEKIRRCWKFPGLRRK